MADITCTRAACALNCVRRRCFVTRTLDGAEGAIALEFSRLGRIRTTLFGCGFLTDIVRRPLEALEGHLRLELLRLGYDVEGDPDDRLEYGELRVLLHELGAGYRRVAERFRDPLPERLHEVRFQLLVAREVLPETCRQQARFMGQIMNHAISFPFSTVLNESKQITPLSFVDNRTFGAEGDRIPSQP